MNEVSAPRVALYILEALVPDVLQQQWGHPHLRKGMLHVFNERASSTIAVPLVARLAMTIYACFVQPLTKVARGVG